MARASTYGELIVRSMVLILLLLSSFTAAAAPPPAPEAAKQLPAGTPAPPLDDPAALAAEGWVEVAPSVLQREQPGGNLQILAFGEAGLRWELERLTERAGQLRWDYGMTGDPDILEALHRLELTIDQTQRDLSAEADGKPGEGVESATAGATVGCNINILVDAEAGPGSSGPWARGTARFSDNCGTYGCVYVDCLAEGYLGSSYRSYYTYDGERCGYDWASASCYASVVADNNCYSAAYARVRVIDSLGSWAYFIDTASNHQCRPPLTVSITGPGSVYVAEGCQTFTWTANPSRAVSSYSWTWDGTVVGSGSSYSRSFCSARLDRYYTSTVGVTVSDGVTSASASKSVTVDLPGSGGPICCDPLEPY